MLERVNLTGGLTLPGVLMLNATTPGANFTFVDVTNTGPFLVQKDYVCQNIHGTSEASTPSTPCFSSGPDSSSSSSSSTGSDAVSKIRSQLLDAAIAALPENRVNGTE